MIIVTLQGLHNDTQSNNPTSYSPKNPHGVGACYQTSVLFFWYKIEMCQYKERQSVKF